ncbi:hypothetical protein KAU40_00295 [Candidatus Parcubacteria bacterium]|nr:hypothetical protein [Candidatus Parcubacteria bacterium]
MTYVPCCPSCSDLIHYLIRHPVFAIVVICLIVFPIGGIEYFICNDVNLGTDEKAEQYYEAILQVHQDIGFNENEYPPSGLTLEQAKEIPCINNDTDAEYWLSEEYNKDIGRVYYYILLAIYHRWLHPEDANHTAMEILNNPEIIGNFTLDNRSYNYATVAYFHNRSVVNAHLLTNSTLPTDELERVKALLPK